MAVLSLIDDEEEGCKQMECFELRVCRVRNPRHADVNIGDRAKKCSTVPSFQETWAIGGLSRDLQLFSQEH